MKSMTMTPKVGNGCVQCIQIFVLRLHYLSNVPIPLGYSMIIHNRLYCKNTLNSLPNDKILDWSKLKAFADDKIKVLKMMVFVFDRVENIVGKGENAGLSLIGLKTLWEKEKMMVTSIFSFSHFVFKGFFTKGWLKSGFCGKEFIHILTQI